MHFEFSTFFENFQKIQKISKKSHFSMKKVKMSQISKQCNLINFEVVRATRESNVIYFS